MAECVLIAAVIHDYVAGWIMHMCTRVMEDLVLTHGGVHARKGLCLWKGNLPCCQIQQLHRKVYWWHYYTNVSETHTALMEVSCFNAHSLFLALHQLKNVENVTYHLSANIKNWNIMASSSLGVLFSEIIITLFT